MTVGDVFRATLQCHWQDSGALVNNVLWFKQIDPTPPSPGEEVALGTSLAAAVLSTGPTSWGRLREGQATVFAYDHWTVQRMLPGIPGGPVTVGIAGGTAGTAGISTVYSCVLATTLKTQSDRFGRRGRGRLYISGFVFNQPFLNEPIQLLSSSRMRSNWTDRVVALGEYLRGRYNVVSPTAGFAWGVWSKVIAGAHAPYTDAWAPVISVSADPIIRVQRRREEGVGL